MADPRPIIGWLLDPDQRMELLQQFPPRYPRVIAHHVTLQTRAHGIADLPSERTGEIVGRADDGRGVEALVVRIGGTTDRPDGSTYHITWSLADGRTPKESNTVIAEHGWSAIDLPMSVALIPSRL